jgi:hypothetical protein
MLSSLHSTSLLLYYCISSHYDAAQVINRDRHDEEIAGDIVARDAVIAGIEAKVSDMQTALADARAVGAGYCLLVQVRH